MMPSSQLISLSIPGGICEVGVYKGGYLITILNNNLSVNSVAIDPYPGLNSINKLSLITLFLEA